MKWFADFITSSIGRKVIMSLTGLFLVSFLLVHVAINALIFYNDGGKTFELGAHFMATNPIIRTIEIFLILGFIIHIVQGIILWRKNKAARSVGYSVVHHSSRSTWYSKSMMLLGTLILLFLVIHTSNFWIPNRIHQFRYGKELQLYHMMLAKFQHPAEVIIYLVGCLSLLYHLLHGFKTAFLTLGIYNSKLSPAINFLAISFSIGVPLVLALMPVSMYLGWLT
jgi:succinate dehydrogenase / fumarate reductase cytochrome b subunit